MKVFFRKVFAIIAAFIILALVSQSMLFIGPVLSGWVIMYFDIEPIGSQNVNTLESSGNIFKLALSWYLGYKTYKK